MKVLMLGRYELLDRGGGDKVQVENTAKELKKLGVEVDIKAGLDVSVEGYDIVHVFQLDWTPETYYYAKKASEAKKPLVLSPIHHSVEEVKKFDDEYVFDFRRVSKLLFKEQHKRDTFKNVYRSIFNKNKRKPTIGSVLMGLKNMHKLTLGMCDRVLVQTQAEAKDLKDTYGVDFEWTLVQNGVGAPFLNTSGFKNSLEFENYVLCVGRIEPRKNQLNVIKAVNAIRLEKNLDMKLVFIGSKSGERHFEYMYRFEKDLKKYPWVSHVETVPYEKMPSYYHFAKVCVSASWFETTGLTSLEALYCGTNAVASGDRAKEILGDLVSYCKPYETDTIKDAILKEYYAKRPEISQEMREHFTWEQAAKKTLDVYNTLLGSN